MTARERLRHSSYVGFEMKELGLLLMDHITEELERLCSDKGAEQHE